MGKKKTKHTPTLVIWNDAYSEDDWTDESEVEKDQGVIVHSAGFLIKKTKTHIILALNHDVTNEKVSCTIYIPTKMVKKIIPLDK